MTAAAPRTCSTPCGPAPFSWPIGLMIPTPFASDSPTAGPGELSAPCRTVSIHESVTLASVSSTEISAVSAHVGYLTRKRRPQRD